MSQAQAYGKSTANKAVEFKAMRNRKAAVLWWLAHHGGTITNHSGRASVELAASIAPIDPAATRVKNFTSMLAEMEADELILRDVKGKRTMAVTLVPTADELARHPRYGVDPWPTNGNPARPVQPDLRVVTAAEEQPSPIVTVRPADGPTAAVDAEWTPPPLAPNADPHALLAQAMAYIAQAMASSKPVTAADPTLLGRLAFTLEDNQRMRVKLNAARDEVVALHAEVTGLRQAKHALEENLRVIANGRLDEGALRRFKELDRMVRSAPGTHKGVD